MMPKKDISKREKIYGQSLVGLWLAGEYLVNSVTHRQRKTDTSRANKILKVLLPVIIFQSVRVFGLHPLLYLISGYFIPAAGYRNNSGGGLNNVGSNGYYWSGSPNSTTNGYNLNFNSGNVNPSNNNNRTNGFSVRCVQAFTIF